MIKEGATLMENELPPINKKALIVTDLYDANEEKQYWLSQTIAVRLNAINRRMVYGGHRTSSRLQRVLEIAEREKR